MLHYIAIHITVSVLRPAGTPRCVAFGLMVCLDSRCKCSYLWYAVSFLQSRCVVSVACNERPADLSCYQRGRVACPHCSIGWSPVFTYMTSQSWKVVVWLSLEANRGGQTHRRKIHSSVLEGSFQAELLLKTRESRVKRRKTLLPNMPLSCVLVPYSILVQCHV